MQVSFTVTFIGLSNSGKTAITHSLAGQQCEIFPTAGFEITYITSGLKSILSYDCSGEGHSRPSWTMFTNLANAVVYVIDAEDTGRFVHAKLHLFKFLEKHKFMRKKPLCIMLNKSDVKNRAPKQLIYKALEPEKIQKLVIKLYVKETSALTKDGLEECIDWISKNRSV